MKKTLDKNMKELNNFAQVLVDINERQIEAQSLYVKKEAKEASDTREQALAMALYTMQEKMDQNSKETSTRVSHILNKIEKVDKELAAAKSDNLKSEMLQIDVIDYMRDDIRELNKTVGVLIRDLQINVEKTLNLTFEMSVIKDEVKNVTTNFMDFQEKQDFEDETLETDILDLEDKISEMKSEMCEVTDQLKDLEDKGDEILENDMLEVQDKISEVRDGMCEVKDQLKDLEKRSDEQIHVKTALTSLKDELNTVRNELASVKDVATNLGKDVMCELKNVKEELTVVKEKTRGASVGQNKMVGAQEVMLYELQKVAEEVSCVKLDLGDIGTEVTDELGMSVGGRLRDVWHELKSIRHEMRAAKHGERELTDAHKDLIKELNDTVKSAQTDHVQNVKPALDDLKDTIRERMMKPINEKKRKRDSRYLTLKHNKRLQKQSNWDKRGTMPISSTSVYPMSIYSSDSDLSTSSYSDLSTSSYSDLSTSSYSDLSTSSYSDLNTSSYSDLSTSSYSDLNTSSYSDLSTSSYSDLSTSSYSDLSTSSYSNLSTSSDSDLSTSSYSNLSTSSDSNLSTSSDSS